MKGLILAAGRGTRLRPLTHTRPKPVIRLAGKPIIRYAVENLINADVNEIGVVVSPDTQEDIRQALKNCLNAKITYIVQEQALGIAHAVGAARAWLGQSPFVLYLGDNLFQKGVRPFVEAFHPDLGAVIALVRVPDPRQFGVAVLEKGRIVQLLEKPKEPPSDLAVAGVYVFSPVVLDIIANLNPSARGEYEITDAIQALIDQGSTVLGREVDGWWKDTGRPDDLLDANRLLLVEQKSPTPVVQGKVEESKITGRVVIEEGAVVRHSTVLGPVHIASGALIEGAYIGPFTSVGPNAKVRQAEVEFSILEDSAVVEDVPLRLHECILGVGARVTRRSGLPKAHKLVLGDLSSLELA
ncbi:Glucose-1-phosphate thymidylyltransferase [Meiothermus luteus]|jgi:glucose-1-phosphate thymidylyltransferase|uniref:Glucose-1-phosphate thymidylyltransferase n=1 Tax=Meiothermus luteus TaxID=2026184 RepID=A0A399EG59_9DEIN|nr:glucose-1-phosphate thymidylyltransferase [Meiothermus luteus]RIH82553.1 Glucose-1-phosphate thymidylyltransferase [Meiothermus luteus]RMH56308.1 MAG: glucose-1-phosphate thymidylyltransferase [Deinococcota bacterium]